MRAGQHRLLAGVIGGWAASRLIAAWPWGRAAVEAARSAAAGALLLPGTPAALPKPALGKVTGVPAAVAAMPRADASQLRPAVLRREAYVDAGAPSLEARSAPAAQQQAGPLSLVAGGVEQADLSPVPPPSLQRSVRGARWFGSAYLFMRPGGGDTALASAGTLGGSQAGLRIGHALNANGRLAAIGRVYRPLVGHGTEAAVGIDWRPTDGSALRLSAERRIGLDRAGRDAWSAYAAHGFYAERGGLVLEGYGQAGVVGAHRGDLFADGALRAGRRVRLARRSLVAGAGLWGAAQPGATRLDAGPRVATGVGSIVLAVEGRVRIAGHARPGSGVTLTIGSDF